MTTKIKTYLDNGVVLSYDVDNPIAAREHADSIIRGGYRSCNNVTGVMTHYPPHRIVKVKCVGEMKSTYDTQESGT